MLQDKLMELQNLRQQRALIEEQNKLEFIKKKKALNRLEKSTKNILSSNKPEKVNKNIFFSGGLKRKE